MSTFQERLRYYREKAGFKKAKDFAEEIGVLYNTYKGYESQNKEPKYETLVKIADKLGITTDELLGHVPTVIYSDSIPKEVADLISRKAEEVKQQYIRDCLDLASLKKERPKKKEQPKWEKKSFSYPALDTNKIRLLMIKSSLNYTDLAKLSGITESALRGILDYGRKPHTSTMGKIANGLQVDLTEIIKE